MTKYASSSILGFVPVGGGCKGHSIEDEPADPDYPYLSIDCPVCEPLVDPGFWAGSPEEVPLTAAEQKELDRLKREAEKRNMQMTDAMAQFLAEVAANRVDPKASEEEKKPAASKPRTRKTSGASA